MRRAALAALLFIGCGSDPLDVAGGLSLTVERASQRIDVTAPGVVKVETCAAPALVVRGPNDGWRCVAIDPAGFDERLAAIEAAVERLTSLETSNATIAAAIERAQSTSTMLEGAVAAHLALAQMELDAGPRVLPFAAATCSVPRSVTSTSAYRIEDGGLVAEPNQGTSAYCPVLGSPGTSPPDALQALWFDPDGVFGSGGTALSLRALTPDGTKQHPGRVGGNWLPTGVGEPTGLLAHPLKFDDNYYYFEIFNVSRRADLIPILYGGRLIRRRLAAPAALQAPGGALVVDCGPERELTDSRGRTWGRDDPFLAPGHRITARSYHGGAVDKALLTDPTVPGGVLETARWCDCEIHYALAVPNARYRVALYFSENCVACVGADSGGTSPDPRARRVFDVNVEGQDISGYDAADAARPPAGDGVGQTFTATELTFDVDVMDGVLDIRLLDLGSSVEAENPSIKAIAIERAP